MDYLRMALDHHKTVGLFQKETMKENLDSLIIHHELCRGTFTFRQVSAEENVLFCPDCGTRINFPVGVKTPQSLNDNLKLFGLGINPISVTI